MFVVLLLVTVAVGLEWLELRRPPLRVLPAAVPGRRDRKEIVQ